MATRTSKRPHLSHSQVEEFTRCPRKYHLHRRLGLAPEFMPSGLLFGSAMHDALALLHESRLAGKNATPKQLSRAFDGCWRRNELPVRYSRGETEEGLKELSRRMLSAYLQHQEPEGEILAVEEPFILQLSDALPDIHGRIDLVELSPDSSLLVTDFKTAKAKTEPETEQLVLYREAARIMGLSEDQAVRARYVCLLKSNDPEVVTFEPEIPDGALDALTRRYTEVWEAIQSGCSFPITGWWCSGCQWARYCDNG